MKIEGRKSIHNEESKTKIDTNENLANHGKDREISSIVDDKTTIRKELVNRSDSYESTDISDTEYSYSQRKTSNYTLESPKSSPIRHRQSASRVRTESPIRHKYVPSKKIDPVHRNKWLSSLLAIVLTCLGIYFFWLRYMVRSENTCSFSELMRRYPREDAVIWKYLKSNIEDILNERTDKPTVTLFVHKGYKGSKEIIRDIAKTACYCFDSSLEPVEFNTTDFTTNDAVHDYGVIIDKYKRVAKEGNVVMIADLNEIPAVAARALHSICDRESPIYRKVVILLSLTAENKGERPIDIAEIALSELWEGRIMENELGPLMARVTGEVLLLEGK